MKSVVILLLALAPAIIGACREAGAGDEADTPENKLRLAQEFLTVQPVDEMLDDTLAQMAQSFPPPARAAAMARMRQLAEASPLRQQALDAAVEVFTVEELRALIDFWSSPVGRSLHDKYPRYMDRLMPTVLKLAMEIARRAREAPAAK